MSDTSNMNEEELNEYWKQKNIEYREQVIKDSKTNNDTNVYIEIGGDKK